jgi:cytochrome P450
MAVTLSQAVRKPAHVPDTLVYDFDMFADPALLADPHHRVLDLVRSAPPLFWTPRYGGHWVVMGYGANTNAALDSETFSSEIVPQALIKQMMAGLPPGTPRIPQPIPVNVDPPDHGKYRLPLQRFFQPRIVNALKDDIRALADRLIDAFIARGSCEAVSAFAEPLPVQVFLRMMGLPLDRQAEYRDLVKRHLADLHSNNPQSAIDHMRAIAAIMRDAMLERREQPREDLISMLWNIEVDGRPVTLEEIEDYCVLLFVAGLDTVINAIAYGIRRLAQDQPLQERLRAEPELIGTAVEELLRRYSFVIPVRRTTKDVVFEGVQLKANDRVMLFLPGAALDSKEFENADQIDLARKGRTHIVFNTGPHHCLGASLARLELQTAYQQLLARLPAFRLDSERPPTFHGGPILGVSSLHLTWG